MAILATALSIADLASEWAKETGEEKLESALARSFFNGKLKLNDPVMASWNAPFWDDGEETAFLYANNNYREHYYLSGEAVIFYSPYWDALTEIADYGRGVTVQPKTAELALSNLFVEKEEFRKWLSGSNRKMPVFWLSESERSIIGSTASTNKPMTTTERAHVSDKLAYMNQAAAKFWGNADRDDRGTHPDNATVAAWLEGQGFSATLADKAATIIRPEWVPTGRKPEE